MNGVANDDDSEFVTVGVAAKRLGVADRTAQRYAARLSDSDRQVSDSNAPQLVRLSAMTTKAKEAAARNAASGVRQSDRPDRVDVGQVSDSVTVDNSPPVRQVSDGQRDAKDTQAALVDSLQGEVAFLRDALKAEQENTRAALAELQRANERATTIIGALGTGRLSLPQVEPQPASRKRDGATEPAQASAPEAQSGAETNVGGQSVHGVKGEAADVVDEAGRDELKATQAPWWMRLWKTKEGR